ncbi:MAG: hypothetical protein Q9162_005055 [Coniocarpon cinnabarinum]
MATTTLLPSTTASITSSSTSSTGTSTCTPAPPAKHDYAPDGTCEQIWEYNVAVPPAAAFAILFGLASIAHIVLACIHRKRFSLVIIMGTVWRNENYYNNNFGLTLLAPLWINAFVYMTLGRMIHYFLPERRLGFIKGRLLARCFVLADIICFFIQIGGVVIAVIGTSNNNDSTTRSGLNVFNAGAGVQQGFIVIFVGILSFFAFTARRAETRQNAPLRPQGWKFLTFALYVALAMISVRCIFRLCEYSKLDDNPLLYVEAYEYGLDAVPMLLASSVFCVLHPGLFLVGPESTWPKSRKGKKALKQQEKEEKAARKARKHGNGETGLVADTSYGGVGRRGWQRMGDEDVELGTFSPSHTTST